MSPPKHAAAKAEHSPGAAAASAGAAPASGDDATVAAEQRRRYAGDWALVEAVFRLIGERLSPTAQAGQGGDGGPNVVDFRQPDELRAHLSGVLSLHSGDCGPAPEAKDDAGDWCRSLLAHCERIVQSSVKTGGGRFMQTLFNGVDPYGLAAGLLIEALNTSAYTFEVGPAVSLIESELIAYLGKQVIGWQGKCDGIFCPGGSMANFYGINLARHKYDAAIKRTGVYGRKKLIIFCSDQAHYSFEKGASLLGLGADSVLPIRTDARGSMDVGALREQVGRVQRDSGRAPMMLAATAGTTVLCGFDSLRRCADVAEECGMWLHVDACLGGGMLFSHEHRAQYLDGIERADSISWCWHKTLGAPFQTSLLLVRQEGRLALAHGSAAAYLFQADKHYDTGYDTGDKSVQCGRRPDALKPWLMVKARGAAHIGRTIDAAAANARRCAELLRRRPDVFELVLDAAQCIAVSFWIKPAALRGHTASIKSMCADSSSPEYGRYLEALHRYAAKLKLAMVRGGQCMLAYQSIANKGLVNFFRVTFKCHPLMTADEIGAFVEYLIRMADEVDV